MKASHKKHRPHIKVEKGCERRIVKSWKNPQTFSLLCLLDSGTRRAPFLELRRGYESCGVAGARPPPSGLPPVVVILADYVQDVPDLERDARLSARDQVVVLRIVAEEGADRYLEGRFQLSERVLVNPNLHTYDRKNPFATAPQYIATTEPNLLSECNKVFCFSRTWPSFQRLVQLVQYIYRCICQLPSSSTCAD